MRLWKLDPSLTALANGWEEHSGRVYGAHKCKEARRKTAEFSVQVGEVGNQVRVETAGESPDQTW